ncbi:MAG: mechanosensitive ion channel [Gammaproteobacteria bacterium]|nr:mechanosensitive ion channel [Gammaproteobacteria bacterium]
MQTIKDWLSQLDTQTIINLGLQWGGKLLIALLIYVVGRRIIRWLTGMLDRGLQSRGVESLLRTFLQRIISITLTVVLLMMVLGQLGVNTASAFALLGAAGLAIGLALKDSLGNFASGVLIILLKPFKVGDFVDIAGQAGSVASVNLLNTELITVDNRVVLMPNSDIMANPIVNFSAKDTRRIDLVIGVDYKDDLQAAQAALHKALEQHADRILKDPAPVVLLVELGASSVDFAVRPWCKSEDYWTLRGELMETIKAELEAAGCSIPFPQQDMHVYQHNAGAAQV